MFTSITYLQSGNEKQQKVYDVLNKLNIMEDLALYSPVLCGTIPIRIDTLQSDLDIVMEVHNFDVFEQEMRSLYGSYEGFRIKKKKIKNTESIKVNFEFEGFEFELFAQPKPVRNQNAYRHIILRLKENGLKTEPAFAQVLNINGDPYEALILLGQEMRLW